MKKTIAVLSCAVMLILAGCSENAGYQKTKSGLRYKIVDKGEGSVVKPGEFLKVHFTQKIGDSVLMSSGEGMPTYTRVDSVGPVYNPAEVFSLLRKGDSVVVVMEMDSLYKDPAQVPPFVKKGDKLTLAFRVLEIFPTEDSLKVDQENMFTTQRTAEVKAIEKYLADNNIQAQKTEKGTFVVIDEPGTGPLADSGKAVTVNYNGKTFEGKVFDSNIDSTFGHPQPYMLVIGQRGAIEGWDDGLRLFRKGGKGKLYIPSMLAYGGNPPPGAPFKAFENLMFEVEILDVQDAPAQQQPRFPGGAPNQ